MEELLAKHRKELKVLDGEKRAAIKKSKATKGKKSKDEIAIVEAEYSMKLHEMEDRHKEELRVIAPDICHVDSVQANETSGEDAAIAERHKKLEQVRLKRETERQRKIERERAREEEAKNLGPTPRDIEMNQILEQLRPLHLDIVSVPADGNCMYRAVAAQHSKDATYEEIRHLCATILEENESEFAPFCELNDNISSYKEYVGAVRSSHDWGGHLELRALSMALRRPFHVYSIQSTNGEPLVIDSSLEASEAVAVEPIRLSYHLHYYALGEHYNSVVRRAQRENDE